MNSSVNKSRLMAFLMLVIFTLTASGCASPANQKGPKVIDEEAYINLKLGFSLVVPSSWVREQIPVSSPRHQTDSVNWLVGNANDPKGALQVSRQELLPRPQFLSRLDSGQTQFTVEMLESVKHPAGAALRWENETNLEKTILFIIEGVEHRYIITCKLTAANNTRLLSTLEKVISSFTILQH